jgi:CheY-like chemotaxis protein
MKRPSAKKDRPLRILVLDDTRTWRELVKSYLENELGIAPIVASGGREALDILSASPIDVVVTDLNMPEMNGIQFVQRARPLFPTTKFIIMTADHVTCILSRECLALGAIAVVSKDEIDPNLLDLLRKLKQPS